MIGLPLIMVLATAGGAMGVGVWGVRLARTTSDLFVASRAISPWWNAAAISGEYLSAASFLGVAGLTMKLGASALWQPVGFTAGYLALLLFVAAPLRRFGSYTIPDFAEARLDAPRMRTLAAVVVLGIGVFYLVPQLKGAGIALQEITGAPYWVGIAAVAVLVAANVSLGGMRAVTYVQAYQFWLKTFAIALPACLLVAYLGGLPDRGTLFGADLPRAPAAGLVVHLDHAERLTFPETTTFRAGGRTMRIARGGHVTVGPGRVVLPPRAAVPVPDDTRAQTGADWSRPVGGRAGAASPLLVYSLLIATFLGTMGLPHILVRFYTSPDGHAARRTTVRVLGLLGLFYLFPVVYALLGRALLPQLYVTGDTDLVVLRLPQAVWPGRGGDLLAGLVASGAFAAFVSTASGLLISIAGTLSHDLWRGSVALPAKRRFARFRATAAMGMVLPAVLALAARDVDISLLVGWAFALAASTFCPLFLLGIWWTRLTAKGAAVGMVVGALGATGAIVTGLALGSGTSGAGALLTQPAVLTVPLAFATMIAVSRRGTAPRGTRASMLALHAPEGLGLDRELAEA